ncbi:MAG: response regulator [Bacteroidales bacterium]|nr:response regulator [Bacteroidales bacterium]
MKYIFTLLAVFLLGVPAALADSGRHDVFKSLSVGDGLPHSDVNAIVQDSTGYLWFATYGGLCKYDGYRLKVYRSDNSGLSRDRVISLYVASDSMLYIGTESGGLNIYNPVTDEITHVGKYEDGGNVTDDVVSHIFEDRDSIVWVCHNNMLSEVCGTGGDRYLKTIYRTASPDLTVESGIAMNEDTLLFSAGGALMMYDKMTGRCERMAGLAARSFVRDGDRILVGTFKGLYEVGDDAVIRNIIPDVSVRHFALDFRKNIWIGTFEEGLQKYDEECRLIRHYMPNPLLSGSISSNEISSVLEDDSGALWVGTIGGGLNMLNLHGNNIYKYSMTDGLSQNRVITFMEDADRGLWVSTHDGGVDVFDQQTGIFRNLYINGRPSKEFSKVSAMYKDNAGQIWIGTWNNGIWIADSSRITVKNDRVMVSARKVSEPVIENCSIYKMADDRDGHVWVSTNRGLWEYIPGKSVWRCWRHDGMNLFSLYSDFTTDIFPDPDSENKTIFIGTRAGLNKLVFDGNGIPQMHRVSMNGSKGHEATIFISDIHLDSKGRLWISTCGDGLYRMTAGRMNNELPAFQHYNTSNMGFLSNELESILEDDKGNLWIGGYGISKLDPESMSVTTYTEKDNLQSNSFKIWAACRMNDGRMAFGGINGFNIFHPDSIGQNLLPPEIVISSIYVRNKKISPSDTSAMTLSYDQNTLDFEFTSFNYSNPTITSYRYRLKGYEENWNTVNGREPRCTYSNLKHGRYCFEVYSLNNDGVESHDSAKVSFVIRPHFLNSAAAYVIYVMMVALFLYGIYKFSQKQAREKNERRVEQEKLRFFTDMSHEIKTPLSLISAPVQELLQSSVIGASTRHKLEVVNRGVVTLQSVVGQILDLRKYEDNMMNLSVSEVDICRFLNETAELFTPLARNRQIIFKRSISEAPLMVFIDKKKMERVVVNLLSNAFKFTPEGGTVCLSCIADGRYITFSIEDNGVGIGENDIQHIFDRFYQAANQSDASQSGTGIGLALSKYIVNHHKGEITVESKVNFGSKFTVKLLKGCSHFLPEQINTAYRNSDDMANYEPIETVLGTIRPSDRKDATVLVVDDNEQLRAYLAELLSTKYNVLTAENGMRAYEIAIAEQPDLILSDIVMPQMSGIDMCQRVKNNEATSHISVVLLTARDLTSTEIDSWKVGADGFIAKPFNAAVLMSRIENLINSRDRMRRVFKTTIDVNPSEITIMTSDEKFLSRCLKEVEDNIDDSSFGVEELSANVGVSKAQLYRKLSSITGQSSIQFIRSIRLKRAAQLLLQDASSVSSVMYMVGFSNLSYFSKLFKEEFGCMPRDYARKQSDEK